RAPTVSMLVIVVPIPRSASWTGTRTTLMSKYFSISVSPVASPAAATGLARKTCVYLFGAGLAPSPEVDKGWHAFILHTADYAEFCEHVAGRFIHHLPDESGQEDSGARVPATVAALRAIGLSVDADLWGS